MTFRWVAGAILSLAMATGAQAGVIQDHIDALAPTDAYFDFRNQSIYETGCDGFSSCTRQEINANNRSVTISTDSPGRTLYRDNADGFGIRGNENDEIDSDEVLTVLFDGGWQATELGLTDLFIANDGGPDGEEAIVRGFRDNTLVYELRFLGDFVLGNGNGEAIFELPGVAIDYLEFHSVENPNLTFTNPDLSGTNVGQSNDEYSVAFIAGTAISVSEPGALALLGFGLAGLGILRRRKI